MLNKSGDAVLWINQQLWQRTPEPVRKSRLGLIWGRSIFTIAGLRNRHQRTTTYFFRNRPELKLMARLVSEMPHSENLNLTVVGCSEGAEVYSIIYTLLQANPKLEPIVQAYDIDPEPLTIAKAGRYDSGSRVLSLMEETEKQILFNPDAGSMVIKPEISRWIDWHQSDPTSASADSKPTGQDIVVANRLLFHMRPKQQMEKLRAIAAMVRPGGYLFVSGLDLNVRTKLAKQLNWQPVTDSLLEIHQADTTMTHDWPFKYWGLEPCDPSHPDYQYRYCSVFRMPEVS